MKQTVLVAGIALTAIAAPGFAQNGGAPDAGAAPPTCYIEVPKLMAEPPTGIADLGAALKELDARLRPQVAEINELRAQMARLEQRQAPASASVQDLVMETGEPANSGPLPEGNDSTVQEMQRVQTALDAKHAQLKLDYAAYRTEIVAPVQISVSQGAMAYGTEQGCREIKMARTPDLAALTAAGARDLTGGFVAWYTVNHPSAVLSSR